MNLNELQKSLKEDETLAFYQRAIILSPSEAIGHYILTNIPVESSPPSGHLKVTNLYVDSVTKKLVVIYSDIPARV